MNIILLGIQGAGKSTQGNLLSKELKIPYISTGHVFRKIAKEKTRLGRTVKELINSGNLIPDSTTLEIVNEYLIRPEYQNGFILDGFPRTLAQAKGCTFAIDKVIYLDLDAKEALWRLVMRSEDRNDNTVQAVQHRVDQFYKHTMPVVAHFEENNIVAKVDAKLSIKEVNKEVLKSLGKQLIKNHVQAWKQKKPILIAFVGMSGSGKTEAVEYLHQTYKVPVVSFSNIINEYIDEHKLKHDLSTHQTLRRELREKYGMEAMAMLREPQIKNELLTNKVVLIEGLYSWEEYLHLQKTFKNAKVVLVATWARKELRWGRAARRTYRKGLHGATRDLQELIDTNKGPAIAYADCLIKNDFTLHEFHDKLDETYRSIIFS